MEFFDFIWNFFSSRRREEKLINHLLELLEGEAEELNRLKTLLLKMKSTSDSNQRYNLYLRFEGELQRFEQYASIISNLDDRILKRTIFANLKKRE